MVLQQNYGVSSWSIPVILILILSLSGCSTWRLPETKTEVVTKVEKLQVPIVSRPKPLQLIDTRVRVVTKENLDAFLQEFEEQYGDIAFTVLSMKDYENLAMNIADLKRFIEQQDEIIVYYEEALTDDTTEDISTDESGLN
jgi:PBP1b-binding outer membrane lipoprotein LpoB